MMTMMNSINLVKKYNLDILDSEVNVILNKYIGEVNSRYNRDKMRNDIELLIERLKNDKVLPYNFDFDDYYQLEMIQPKICFDIQQF